MGALEAPESPKKVSLEIYVIPVIALNLACISAVCAVSSWKSALDIAFLLPSYASLSCAYASDILFCCYEEADPPPKKSIVLLTLEFDAGGGPSLNGSLSIS